MLNKAFRDAKSYVFTISYVSSGVVSMLTSLGLRQYMAEWSTLTSLLTTSTSTPRFGVPVPGSSERAHLKESATAFFDRLSELEGLCAQYPLSRQDPEMRDRVGREVEELVMQAYSGFLARCQGKGLDKCEYFSLFYSLMGVEMLRCHVLGRSERRIRGCWEKGAGLFSVIMNSLSIDAVTTRYT